MQGYRRGLLPKPSPRFHPRVNEQRNSLREETIRHAVRLDPIFDAYIHPSPSFPHGRYACAVRKPVRARCFGEFCYVLFSHTSKLFGTNPSNVLFCFYFSFIPLADFASRPRFHSIPFDSIVLRCLSHKQFPLIRGTQPSGTIRREPTNKSTTQHNTTHTVTLILRHDSEGTIQSSGPIQWTNQPTTNQPPPPPRLGGNIRYHANTYASSHNIDIDINSNTLRHDSEGAGCDPRGTVSPDSFIHSNILSCWDDGSLLSFCVRTHTYAHQ